jgi:AraC-like DNA-binding protein
MARIVIDPSEERRILDLRPLGFRDVVVLGRYCYAAVHRGLEEHCHGRMMEICYLDRGEQTYFVGQERFDMTGGDVFVAFPGEKHGTGQSPEGRGVLYWMLIHMPRKGQRFLSLAPTVGQPLVDALLGLPTRQFSAGGSLGKTLHGIFAAYDRVDDPLRIVEIQNLCVRFLLDMVDASRKPRPEASPEIVAVQRHVAKNIDGVFTVRQLARVAGLSEARFKMRFKAETGIPPAEYVLRQKVERAKLLLQTQATVTDVGMQLGFSTSQHFSTVFRRYTGQNPSKYRDLHRTGGV